MLNFLVYLGSGRLVIWLIQINGLLEPLKNLHPKIKELIECDLCLGFWVYLLLNVLMPVELFTTNFWVGNITLNAMLSTSMMHLIRLGWEVRFNNG